MGEKCEREPRFHFAKPFSFNLQKFSGWVVEIT